MPRPSTEPGVIRRSARLSRYFVLIAAVWMIAMTWRLYPQFGAALRVDGRLTTVDDYIDDACGQRVGPEAATCLRDSRAQAQHLLAQEQGKSILLIEAPLLFWLVLYLPLRLITRRRRGETVTPPA